MPVRRILPQQLYWFSKGQQHDKATAHNIADCIECGACAWVCPSNIPWCSISARKKPRFTPLARKKNEPLKRKHGLKPTGAP
ncbi:4Fe-4S dicluster domain-containing protein [Shigella flexneri]